VAWRGLPQEVPLDIRMNSKGRNTKWVGFKGSGFAPAFHTVAGRFSASLLLAVCTLFPVATAAQVSNPESPAGKIGAKVPKCNSIPIGAAPAARPAAHLKRLYRKRQITDRTRRLAPRRFG
jgi:hypothetical protein